MYKHNFFYYYFLLTWLYMRITASSSLIIITKENTSENFIFTYLLLVQLFHKSRDLSIYGNELWKSGRNLCGISLQSCYSILIVL